ncbi:competence/damage-inducible protein A [Candidatus Binatia bacterium]|nr:competence/damage-inducible protein A [Candidatus Binatia bacterium]
MIARAAILSTGDELTTGRTVDTNANFIADRLVAAGLDVTAIVCVGDYPERIAWAWDAAMRQADLVVSTGGLGPTADDLTTETVARVIGRPLVLDEAVATRIRQMFEAMGRVMPENNLKQAMIPQGATVLPNALGTAPGFRLDLDTPHGCKHLVVLPGVPREMKPMLEELVRTWLGSARGSDEVYLSHSFQTFGISESALDELVAGAVDPAEGRIAFRAAFPQISVRLTVHGNPDFVPQRLVELSERLRQRIGIFAYGEGDTSMEAVVGQLLTAQERTLAVAESCTGGLVGHRLTAVAGSSVYYRGSVVAYANDVKVKVLGVGTETIDRYGAVSVETAGEMAEGVRHVLGANLGIAVTGIAGPEGGTPDKPVGTVCIGLADNTRVRTKRYQLWGNREWVKLLSSQVALDWLRRHLLGLDPTEVSILRR